MSFQDTEHDRAQIDIQAEILRYLKSDRRIAWAARVDLRNVFRGCSEILGQLETGQFLAVDVIGRGEPPTARHAAFLDQIDMGGGVVIPAHDIEDVRQALEAFHARVEPVSEDELMAFDPETVLLMSEVSINPTYHGYRRD